MTVQKTTIVIVLMFACATPLLTIAQVATPQEPIQPQGLDSSQAAGQSGAAGQKTGKAATGELKSTANIAQASLSQICPPPAGVKLAAEPPSATEYAALIMTLVNRYGAKLDPPTRASLDAVLAKPGGGNGASVGAVLNAAAAIDESVYVSAAAALRDLEDILAANNLGVSLSEAGEHEASARVLLYAVRQRPQSPLASVNLAWTYFNAGATSAAQGEFQRARGLAPDMAAPEAGLGLIAACRNDTATAMTLLKSSLKKGYSGVAAAALVRMQASQSTKGQSSQDQSSPDKNQQSSQNQSESPIPDLPVFSQPERTAPQLEQLNRLRNWSGDRVKQLVSRFQDVSARVKELNRRAKQDGGNAINLPIVFDRELFEFRQILGLAYAARFRNLSAAHMEVTQVQNANAQATLAMIPNMKALFELQKNEGRLYQELLACGDNQECQAKVQKMIDANQREMDVYADRVCQQAKQSMDVTYGQDYKLWKTHYDDLRPAAADFYALTDPVLERVWVPSLNEMLQVQRELVVLQAYQASAGMAASLADMAQGYKDLKCVPPPPPESSQPAKEPKMSKKAPPPCPFSKPVSAGVGPISFSLGCDHAAIEGGEGLRFKARRDFNKHETTVWVGAGASAGGKMDFVGPMSPKVELTAEVGAGVTIGQNGAITDVFVSTQLAAGASIGPEEMGMSASGTAALQGGATLSGSLPGGLGGTMK